jgi:hypothetical protein
MSKRKASKASSKQVRKVAAKAQQASQAVVRSPKPRQLRSEDAVFGKPATGMSVPEKPTLASQDNSQPTMRQNDLMKAFNVFSAMTNIAAYQRRLPKLAQAYMQLGFEFTQKLAQIKSPFEISSVFADVAVKQLAIFQNSVIPTSESAIGVEHGSRR